MEISLSWSILFYVRFNVKRIITLNPTTYKLCSLLKDTYTHLELMALHTTIIIAMVTQHCLYLITCLDIMQEHILNDISTSPFHPSPLLAWYIIFKVYLFIFSLSL